MDGAEPLEPDGERHCGRCGARVSAGDAAGICPRCLLVEGLGLAAQSAVGLGDFLPPEPADLGLIFPEFEITSLIGRGGMGAVYRARDRELDRVIAIKILPPEVGCDAEFQERFRQEATTLANLNHPNIVTLHGAGEREGYFYFVMEFIEGTDLSHLLLREQQLPAERSVDIAAQLCDALEYSHDQGVVHRDIKPANILLDEAGRVKVADFGLAKILQVEEQFLPALTRTRSSMGTVQYMAPEQAAGATQLDHRVDVYAIGAVMYEMLTGFVPAGAFDRPSEKVPGLNRSFDDVILRALSSEPERRFQSVADVRSGLVGASTSRKYFRQKWLRRVSMAALVCLSVGAGVAGYAWLNEEEPAPPVQAEPAVAAASQPAKPLISTDGVASLIDRIRAPAKTMVPLARLPTPDEPAMLVGYGPGIPQVDGEEALAFAISREPGQFSAAISPEGTVQVWGEMSVPNDFPEATAIAAGARHLVVLHGDGSVSTLGGDGSGENASGVIAVDASMETSWALHGDGRLSHWGDVGELAPPPDLPKLEAIAAGDSFLLALADSGELVAWGDNSEGQCDLPDMAGKEIVAIAAGSAHGLVLLADGTVIAWGRNVSAQCDTPPVKSKAVRIFAGGDSSASISIDGRLNAWGEIPDEFGDPQMPVSSAVAGGGAWIILGSRNG